MISPELSNDAGTIAVFASLLVLLIFLLIGSLGYAVVLRPKLQLRRRLSSYGLVALRSGGSSQSTVNPRQRRIQEKLEELEEKGNQKNRRQKIRAELLQAGLEINLRKYFFASGIIGVVLGGLSLLLQLPFLISVFVLLIGTFGLPNIAIKQMAKSRQKKFTQNFANALDIMVRGVKSGLPVGECLKIIARETEDPIAQSFQLLVEGQNIVIALQEQLERGVERMPTAEFKFFTIVLLIQQQTGGNMADTLEGLSSILRERKNMREKVKALSSEAKASTAIIGSLPFCVAGMIALINPDYIGILFTETIGIAMLVGGLCWMGIGIFIMSKMINFDM